MPNTVNNTLTLECNNETLEQFYNNNKNDTKLLDICKINIDNNKTIKWINDIELTKQDNKYIYYFTSAWSSPYMWLSIMSLKYKNIKFILSSSCVEFGKKTIFIIMNGLYYMKSYEFDILNNDNVIIDEDIVLGNNILDINDVNYDVDFELYR